MKAQWPGQKEKIKIMCSIACVQPNTWKIPIKQHEMRAKGQKPCTEHPPVTKHRNYIYFNPSVCCMKNHSTACPVWGKGRTLKSKSVRDKRPVLHTATLCSTHYIWCMHSIRWQHLLKCMLRMRHWYNSSCWLHPPSCGHDNIWRKWYTKRFLLPHSNTTSSFAGIPNILFWTVYKKGVASGSVERSRCSGLNKRSF